MLKLPEKLLLICRVTLLFFTMATTALAQSENPKTEIQFGFDSTVKLGSWFPVFIDFHGDQQPATFEITAADGDAIPITYRGPARNVSGNRYELLCRVGRANQKISIAMFNAEGERLFSTDLTPGGEDNYPKILASTTSQILTIEPNAVTREIVQTSAGRGKADVRVVTTISSAEQLPTQWLSYQGVNKIIASGADAELINSISPQQWDAINRWIMNGGSFVFCAGKNCTELLSNKNGVARFLPGEFDGAEQMESSSRIEYYVKSNDQLIQRDGAPIQIAAVSNPVGVVDLQQGNQPLVVRKPLGFGEIVFSAIDFDLAPVSDWPGQKNYLIKLLNKNQKLNQAAGGETRTGRVSHFGFSDLTGQMLVPLERFSKVRFVTFTWIAALIILYILCIGPGDYFLLKKFFKRMEMTWVTFTLLTLGFCGLAYLIADWTRPSETQINQIEIVDIDIIDGIARGNVWTNVFSPKSSDCSVDTTEKNALNLDTNNSCVSWLGLPGDGLGGMRTSTTTNFLQSPYVCEFEQDSNSQDSNSHLVDLPFQVSSTKTLLTQWWTKTDMNVRSSLRLTPQIGRLQGFVTNPLNVELKNGRILFENWAYLIDQPLDAGETINIESDTRERTASSYLTRRIRDKEKGVNAPWNPEESRIDRIADMMLFYSAAGGQQYTGLTHGYQNFLDMSNALHLERAILVGEIDGVCTELAIGETDSGDQQVNYDQVRTFVRIVLPVEYKRSRN